MPGANTDKLVALLFLAGVMSLGVGWISAVL